MNAITDKLDKDLIVDLAAIRSAVEKLSEDRLPRDTQHPIDLIDQGNRMIDCFESWLLDDEQMQVLSMLPRHLFILYASTYLGGIGLTDGADGSDELIRKNWQDLGIADATLADIIARVCRQAGSDDGRNPSAAESKAAVIDGAAVNVSLLAACLRLARALEPTSTATLSQIYNYLPEKDHFSRDRLTEYFSVSYVGPHPYLNGTIRLKIKCTHPEIHRDTRIDFGFISQFGIGFLSSFLVAKKIVIKTRKASFPGMVITISGLRDYFDVRVLEEDFPVGTEVTLHLKESRIKYCRSLEFAGYLKTNIRFLKIPLRLKDERGNTTTIGQEQLAYNTTKTAGPVFLATLNFKDSEGYVRLGAKNLGDHIHALETASGGVSVFQDGIFVTQIDSLLPEGARSHVVTRINLIGQDKCELSMDRNRMFWTAEQLQHIKKTIRYGLVDVANQLMKAVQGQEVPVNTLQSIVNNLAIFFDFSDVDDTMYDQLCEPLRKVVEKRFRDFVRISFSQKLRASGAVEAHGYSESWQRKVLESFVKD